ncbi:MAG: hypothetical protein M3X11_15750 [Acidobacteriota bacterium]|nr:hypothetical protein [Acidobacteriota bacterium]
MNVLLDHCVPKPLKRKLFDLGTIRHTSDIAWGGLANGALLREAEKEFDVFLTVDKGQRFQQNISSFDLGFVVVRVFRNSLPEIVKFLPQIRQAVADVQAGQVILIGEPLLLS